MVAAAAPSSAPARRGLRAGPGPSGGPGAGMGSSRGGGGSAGAGRREVGGRGRETGWRGPARPRRTAIPGTAGLFVWAAGRPHRARRNREEAAGAAAPGRAVLRGLRGREALGPRRERLARTGLTGGPGPARPGPRGADRGYCHDLGDSSP